MCDERSPVMKASQIATSLLSAAVASTKLQSLLNTLSRWRKCSRVSHFLLATAETVSSYYFVDRFNVSAVQFSFCITLFCAFANVGVDSSVN